MDHFGGRVEVTDLRVCGMGYIGCLVFGLPMDSNAKKTEDDAGNSAFVVEVMAFSTIYEINNTIWYILVMEVAWGKLFIEFMGCSPINTRGMHDWVLRATYNVADEMIDTME